MQKESLEIAVDIIIDALDKSDINIMDKVELMRNLKTLLENYEEDIQVLQEHQKVKVK